MATAFYSVKFSAGNDAGGMGVWAFSEDVGAQEGTMAGADIGGLLYDAQYRREAGKLIGQCDIDIPAGARLANGTPVPVAMSYKVPFEIPADDLTIPFMVRMPVGGPINVALRLLKTVP
jgi:hypothetical protein